MYKKGLTLLLGLLVFLGMGMQHASSQEPVVEGGFVIEEEIEAELLTELPAAQEQAQFITSDVLIPVYMEPVLKFYIRSDIDRKFSGLIINLKLEKIYGVFQDGRTATVYFSYSYASVRNRDNTLYEKGKMTFMKFNSGKWFNTELSIFLKSSYADETPIRQ
jgi:hypothetical protein